MRRLTTIKALFFVSFLTSCVKDVDFDQIKELEPTPSYVVSLVNFEIPQPNLVSVAPGVIRISDKSEITAFKTEEAQNSLEKANLQIAIENTFDRDFTVTVNFLNSNDAPTYQPIIVRVNANDLAYRFEKDILIANNPNFLNTTQIEVVLELQPLSFGESIDKSFTFKSAATLFFRIK